jgi:subtilisin family serine protease
MLESEAPTDVLEAIARQHDMTREETVRFNLTGRTTHVWRINGNIPVSTMLDNVAIHPEITGGHPIYFFVLAQSAQTQANAEQYAPQKLHLTEAHRLASGKGVRIAIIDSEVDASHPDLAGAIGAHFRAKKNRTCMAPAWREPWLPARTWWG